MNALRLIFSNPRYLGPVWLFASLNVVVSTWVIYVPTVRDRLGLDEAEIGLALFSFSCGMLLSIPPASTFLRRVGLGRGTFAAAVGFALLMCLPVQATSYRMLVVALFLAGLCNSVLDIGMNAMVSELEERDGVKFMSAAHGFFSLGGVIGAGIGSLLLPVFARPLYHSLAVAAFILITNALLLTHYRGLRTTDADRGGDGKFRWSLIRPLLGLTVLAVIIVGSEGAVEHWSKLYLLDVVGVASDRWAGFGFVLFSVCMMTGRFLGDGVSERIGAPGVVLGGSLLAAIGFGLTLLALPVTTYLGFAIVGLGFSVIVPELFRLAGRAPGVSAAEGISVVAGVGYVGFLASPAVLGFVADWGGLRVSFVLLTGASLLAAGIGAVLRRRGRA